VKAIYTLVPDIYKLLERKDEWFTDDVAKTLSDDISARLRARFKKLDWKPSLRLSRMGPTCPKALWHSIHTSELEEALPPWAQMKYCYGHILEALAITLARTAGHSVAGEQDELVVEGIKGHRDCVLDGCIVDVKSVSSIGFKKYQDKSLLEDDSFGYLDQLDGYLLGSREDPIVTVKDKGYILAIDKTLGKMILYEHRLRANNILKRIEEYKRIVGLDKPPACKCGRIPEGKSGNIKLDTKASYSPFKHTCHPHLRTFLYARGPVYFTTVVREPKDVPELLRSGRVTYNNLIDNVVDLDFPEEVA
jgi:hypothetical protein